MTQTYQFDFEKTYKEIDVSGDVYRVNFNDEAIKEYQKSVKRFHSGLKELEQLTESDIEKASDAQIEASYEKQKELVKDVVETFLGENTFDALYEKAGRAVVNLMGLVYYLIDIFDAENKAKNEEVRAKYLANKKK